MRDGTTSEDSATQLLICEPLSFAINRGKTSCHLTLNMQHSLHRILLLIFLLTIPMIFLLLILMFIFVLLVMINCVMRALSSGLSEGWSRSPAPTRIAGTLPKMQWLHVGLVYFCIFVLFARWIFVLFRILYFCICNGLDNALLKMQWLHVGPVYFSTLYLCTFAFSHFLEYCTSVFAVVWKMHSRKCSACSVLQCTALSTWECIESFNFSKVVRWILMQCHVGLTPRPLN